MTIYIGSAWGGQYAFVGARAVGMGGANAATTSDATAIWHNPSVFGFMNQSRDEDSAVATNMVVESEETVAQTNAIPADAVVTTAVESIVIESNSVPEPVAMDDAETNAVLEAELTTELAAPVAGAYGPAALAAELPAEEGYNLLDNNGLADRTFGWNLFDFSLGYTMTEDMGRYLDILTDIDFDTLDTVSTPEQVSDLVALAAALKGVADPGNSFYMDANAGTAVRMGKIAVGLRLFGEAAIRVDELDSVNLGLAVADADASLLNVAGADTSYPGGYLPVNLSPTQQSTLTGAGLSQASVDYLDYQVGLLLDAGTIQQSDLDNTTDLLADIVAATGGTDLADNQTTVLARGFALAEIPISYGHAINDRLSVGVTAKAMYGRVLGTRVWVFDDNNLDEAVQSVSDTESDTLTFGLDLGALYRMKNFQFAAVAHNLNRPTFDGYTDSVLVNGTPELIVVPDVKLDPQVTVGAAFIPSKRFMLEINYDLLETGTLLDGYDIQRLSIGGEIDLWALALRIGTYNNLAESEQDWVLTAGIGANIFGVRADIGGAYSLGEKAEYDGTEIPAEARLGMSISLDY